MEKKVLFTQLDDRGSHLRKQITPTAVVSDEGKYPAGMFWDANKTIKEIVAGASDAQDTLKEIEDKLNGEIGRAKDAEEGLSEKIDDLLGIDALDIEDLKQIVEDLDPETGILSVIEQNKEDIALKANIDDISVEVDTAGHEYVEIAGIKWATMNIGADSITDTGLYFQWGDTQGYTADQVGTGDGQKYFGWEDYKYSEGGSGYDSGTITKYNETDGKTVLDPEDDAATVIWGDGWRIPTADDYAALGNAVNSTWTSDYQGTGIAGMVCVDKNDSSKVLFFPACGACSQGNAGSNTNYYSSSSINLLSLLQQRSMFFWNPVTAVWYGTSSRASGLNIRPIYTGSSIKILGTTILDSEREAWNNASEDTTELKQTVENRSHAIAAALCDLDERIKDIDIPTNVSAFTNDAGYLTQHQDISGKANKATTLAGYGITDAKIVNGVVTLGNNTITPLTSHQDISGKADKSATVSDVAYDTTNKKITKTINGTTSDVVTTAKLKTDMALSKSDVGLGNVGNFKAVSTEASQGLTSTEQANARANIGAGTSSFSGSYNDLTNKPTIPAEQVNSDWNASSGKAQILNKPTIITSYGDLTYSTNSVSTSGSISLDGRIPIHLVTLTGNASAVSLSYNPAVGHSCHVIFTATAARTVAIAYNSTSRITPDASDISLDVPANGYVEVDFLNISDKIYVRGV